MNAIHERFRIYNDDFRYEVGRRMGIDDLTDTYEALFSFNEAYEREHFRFHENNRAIGIAHQS